MGFVFLEECGIFFIAAGGVGAVPDRGNDAPFNADAAAFDFQQMGDGEVHHVGNRGDGGRHAGDIYHRIAHGIVIINAHVGKVKEVFAGRGRLRRR